jgi:hypothetical protein
MSAVPLSVPGFAICIALLCTVASTLPSMTRTSQSEMSTPLSLMLTPTCSLLPGGSAPDAGAVAAGGGDASVAGGAGGATETLCDGAGVCLPPSHREHRGDRNSAYPLLPAITWMTTSLFGARGDCAIQIGEKFLHMCFECRTSAYDTASHARRHFNRRRCRRPCPDPAPQ